MKYFFMKFVVINFANPLYDSGFGKKENFIVTSKFYCIGDLILLIKPSCSCVCANLICVISRKVRQVNCKNSVDSS